MVDHTDARATAEYKREHSNLARAYIEYSARLTTLEDAAENALECLMGCVKPAGGCDDEATLAEATQMLRSALARATQTNTGELPMADQLPADIAEAIEAFGIASEVMGGYFVSAVDAIQAEDDAARARAALDAAILKHLRATDLGRSALEDEGRGT